MYRLCFTRTFTARHALIGGDWGPENDVHPHDYRIEWELRGRDLDRHGYLFGAVPANLPPGHPARGRVPRAGLLAHLDTFGYRPATTARTARAAARTTGSSQPPAPVPRAYAIHMK